MANVLTTNPYKIDTVMASSFRTTGGLPNNGPIFITEIYWENPVTIGDTFVLTDNTGTVIRIGRCEVANQSQVFSLAPMRVVSDFTVSTLASGTLYILTL
jgi:hypothetical protein